MMNGSKRRRAPSRVGGELAALAIGLSLAASAFLGVFWLARQVFGGC